MSDASASPARRVAVLVEHDFEDRELPAVLDLLRTSGASVTIVGPTAGADYRGKRNEVTVRSDISAGAARIGDFDVVVVPGGYAPDRMRMRHAMADLGRDALHAGKPVAAIYRGPQLLITVNALRGRTATCWPSIAIDVKNAGGKYVDRPVVEDGPVITARKWDDAKPFCDAILNAIAKLTT
jgi:protease I